MYGPLEYVVIDFPGSKFNGAVGTELAKIVEKGLIRVIDLLFVSKDEHGKVESFELSDVDPELRDKLTPAVDSVDGLVSHADVEKIGAMLENDSSAGILLIEDLWAKEFKQACLNSGGRLIARETVADQDLEATLQEIAELSAQKM